MLQYCLCCNLWLTSLFSSSTITNAPLLGGGSLSMMLSGFIVCLILNLAFPFSAQSSAHGLGSQYDTSTSEIGSTFGEERSAFVKRLLTPRTLIISRSITPLFTLLYLFRISSTLVATRDREEMALPQVIIGVC